jgi:hypothetical protein
MKVCMALMFCATLSVLAQDAPKSTGGQCPIVFVSMNRHAHSKTYTHIYVPALNIVWRNNTDKPISGLKFRVRYFDATGDPHDASDVLTSGHKARPNEQKRSQWDLLDAEPYIHYKMEVWPEKVLFEDGTTWINQGEVCKGNSEDNKGSWWTR